MPADSSRRCRDLALGEAVTLRSVRNRLIVVTRSSRQAGIKVMDRSGYIAAFRARVSRMRRGIGMLVLAVIVVGAAWCADGCPDPTDQTSLPHSASVSACICVIPFATVAAFSLPERELARRRYAEVTIVHLWLAPVLSIDHPPRFL